MKKSLWKSRLAGVLIVSMLSSTFSYAGTWQREAEGWIWQDQGVRATGWLKEPGDSWYHFTPDGLMETGWYQESSGDRYYLNRAGEGTEGQMRTGWFLENGKWYFLSPVHDGFFGRAARDQWLWIDGHCYRFDANGVMYADCTTPDGYTVNGDGRWTVNGVVQYQEGKGILKSPDAASGPTEAIVVLCGSA